MFSLVKFVEDGIYYVCNSKYIRKTGRGDLAKWHNNRYYEAEVLVSGNREQLTSLCDNIVNGFPIIILEKPIPPKDTEVREDIVIIHYEENFDPGGCQPVENTESYIVCKHCGLLLSNLYEHMNLYHYKEQYENYDLPSMEDGNLGQVDKSNESYLLCMYCGLLLPNLDEHIKTVHDTDYEYYVGNDNIRKCNPDNMRYPTKKHNCPYCKTLHTKLARHLERKHQLEKEVQEALKLPKGSTERKFLFLSIQKKGDFFYNSENIKHLKLRRSFTKENTPTCEVPCPYCLGFYSKNSLRNHIRLYCPSKQNRDDSDFENSNNQVRSRSSFPQIHEKASEILKKKVFPHLHNDEITRAIAYDELVIVYANLLVIKYSTSNHHHKMIRNKMRHIGRILVEMRKNNQEITDVTSIYDPSNFDSFIKAVHNLAGLHDGKFQAPSFGPASVTLISQIGNVLEVEAIKKKNERLETNTKQFLKLLNTYANSLINKIASENRTQSQRTKVVHLPSTEDVKELWRSLHFELEQCLRTLENRFDLHTWEMLNKITLINIMIFNRKRPGDVEKSQIIEYENRKMVEKHVLEKLDSRQKKFATMFGRYISRGKLDSPAPILVSKVDMFAIEQISKYRHDANVDNNNPYLFATPSGSSNPYYKAGKAISDFCCLKGLQNRNLSATKLRKHLATVTCTLEQEKQAMCSDFMGHALNIHNKIYRQRPVFRDVVEMGKVLTNALGMDENNILDNFGQHETGMEHNKIVSGTQHNSNITTNETHTHLYTPVLTNSIGMDENNILDNFGQHETQIEHNEIVSTTHCNSNVTTNETQTHLFTPEQTSDEELMSLDEDYDYQRDLSTILESDTSGDDDNVKRFSTKNKRKSKEKCRLFPKQSRPIKRATWRTPERVTARDIFQNYLQDNNDVPSLETCQEFIYKNRVLQSRTAHQVRAWVIYEKKRLKQKAQGKLCGWSTPTKQLCRNYFKTYYKTGTYPTTEKLQDAINKFPELSHTTAVKLRSHLQHDYKYVKIYI